MAQDATCERAVTVAAFKHADDTTVDAQILFLCHLNHIRGETGIKIGGDVHPVSLHSSALPLARIKASGEEYGSFGLHVGLPELVAVVPQEFSRFVEQNQVPRLVQLPEL